MTSGVSISSERANSDRSRPSDREVSSGSAFSAFRIPHFAPLWTSNLLQYFSFQMQRIALQWLVTELTSSRTLLGMVGFMQGATMVVVSPMAGVLIDRAPKRTLVGSGRFMLAALSSLLAVLAGSGLVEIWHILAIAVMTGAVMASTQPAIQTLVFDIAGRDQAQKAVALNATAQGSAQLAGPALAGVVIASVGLVATFTSSAIGLLLSALLVAAIPARSSNAPAGPRSALHDLREGFAYVAGRPPLLLALLICALAIFNGALPAMRPIFARHVLEVDSVSFGLMAASHGVGTMTGALLAALLPTVRRTGIAMALSMLAYAICLMLYALAFNLPYVLVIEFAAGLVGQFFNVSVFAGIQMAVPDEMRGRVMGIVFMLIQLAAVGQLGVGALADAVGDQMALGFFGIVPAVALTAILIFGHRTLDEL